jgi:hypothetical protein
VPVLISASDPAEVGVQVSVGWVERSETHRHRSDPHVDEPSPQLSRRRELFLLGQSRRPSAIAVDRAHQAVAGGVPLGNSAPSFRDRSRRGPARPSPYDLDLPEADADFATRWRLIKSAFAHALPRGEPLSPSGSGSGAIGSIRCATRTILPGTSITSTSTRSGMAMRSARKIGRIRRSAAGSGSVVIPEIGQVMPATRSARSARGDGFRFRSTHPTLATRRPPTRTWQTSRGACSSMRSATLRLQRRRHEAHRSRQLISQSDPPKARRVVPRFSHRRHSPTKGSSPKSCSQAATPIDILCSWRRSTGRHG